MRSCLSVYVPRPGSGLRDTIAQGSGIVGTPSEADDRVKIHYEGNLYRAEALRVFANRVATAAGRHTANYPTVARAVVPSSELILVGEWDDLDGQVFIHPDQREHLVSWLGFGDFEDLPVTELVATGARYEQRRSLQAASRSPNPAVRDLAMLEARRLNIEL